MIFKETIKTIALCTVLMSAGTTYSHGNEDHGKPAGSVRKEQKDWGIAGDSKTVKRTIEVKMTDDMRFSPDKIEVKQGETIKFVISNAGRIMHEFVIGTKQENDAHAQQMLKFPSMEHDEPYMAHVKPKSKGEIVWTFNKPGDFEFACLIAGHYQSGMVGKIKVIATLSNAAQAPTPAVVAAPPAPTAPSAQPTQMAEAEVRKIDREAKKITLKHGPIKSLDMPSMTMVFQVRDDKLLDKLTAGEKIKFTAEQQQGAFVVTSVERTTTP